MDFNNIFDDIVYSLLWMYKLEEAIKSKFQKNSKRPTMQIVHDEFLQKFFKLDKIAIVKPHIQIEKKSRGNRIFQTDSETIKKIETNISDSSDPYLHDDVQYKYSYHSTMHIAIVENDNFKVHFFSYDISRTNPANQLSIDNQTEKIMSDLLQQKQREPV